MTNAFQTILVPVDFSINTDMATKKAIELAGEYSVIHLLYVQANLIGGLGGGPLRFIFNTQTSRLQTPIDARIEDIKQDIKASHPSMRVVTWVTFNYSVQAAIEKKSKQIGADLIIIGKNSHHTWLPILNSVVPGSIAEKTGIPVLTVKPGSKQSRTKKVVIPVTTESTEDKMEIIKALSSKYRLHVFLVTFLKDNRPVDFSSSSLLKMYQWLKQVLNCPVEYAVLHGRNRAKEVMHYAENIDADLLILNSKTETKTGWWNSHVSDIVPLESKMEILAVQPH